MKVKNIVFSGFAAAVLMGVAADASATTEIATKAYVDRLDKAVVGADGSYIKTVKQDDGFVTATPTTFDTEISNTSTHDNAPTSKAVYDYVTDVADFDNLNLDPVGADGSYIKIVKQENGLVGATPTTFDTAISAQSSDSNAPTSKAVYTAIQGANNGLNLDQVGGAGYYVTTVAQANGRVSATETQFDTAIDSNSSDSNAPTSKAVYTAIQSVADTVPDATECLSELCVWTSQGWKDATTPLE